MAKSWSGFLPQNQDAKEQWRALEMAREELELYLGKLQSGGDSPEDEVPFLPLEVVES